MRSCYEVLSLIRAWHLQSLGPVEKRFIGSMFEGCQGVGDTPSDEELKEQCGITDKQIKWVRRIGRKFFIQ